MMKKVAIIYLMIFGITACTKVTNTKKDLKTMVESNVLQPLYEDVNIREIINQDSIKFGLDSVMMEEQHYFDLKIRQCFQDMLKDTIGVPKTYYIYKGGFIRCVIEEVKFRTNESSSYSYSQLNREAEIVRTGKRSDFGSICFEPREAQFYYVFKQNKLLYLFSDGNSYNYYYDSSNDSNESVIRRDQIGKNDLIFDDIYNSIKSNIKFKDK